MMRKLGNDGVSGGDDKSSLRQALRKTKTCRDFAAGKCRRGNKCAFAHNDVELRNRPDLGKTKLCGSVIRGGVCTGGQGVCTFAHDVGELRPPDATQRPKTVMCRFVGSDARIACKYGDRCAFAHTAAELQANLPVVTSTTDSQQSDKGELNNECGKRGSDGIPAVNSIQAQISNQSYVDNHGIPTPSILSQQSHVRQHVIDTENIAAMGGQAIPQMGPLGGQAIHQMGPLGIGGQGLPLMGGQGLPLMGGQNVRNNPMIGANGGYVFSGDQLGNIDHNISNSRINTNNRGQVGISLGNGYSGGMGLGGYGQLAGDRVGMNNNILNSRDISQGLMDSMVMNRVDISNDVRSTHNTQGGMGQGQYNEITGNNTIGAIDGHWRQPLTESVRCSLANFLQRDGQFGWPGTIGGQRSQGPTTAGESVCADSGGSSSGPPSPALDAPESIGSPLPHADPRALQAITDMLYSRIVSDGKLGALWSLTNTAFPPTVHTP